MFNIGDTVIHKRTGKEVTIVAEAMEWQLGDYIVIFNEDSFSTRKLYSYDEEQLTTREDYASEDVYLVLIENHNRKIVETIVLKEFPNLSTLTRLISRHNGYSSRVRKTNVRSDI